MCRCFFFHCETKSAQDLKKGNKCERDMNFNAGLLYVIKQVELKLLRGLTVKGAGDDSGERQLSFILRSSNTDSLGWPPDPKHWYFTTWE